MSTNVRSLSAFMAAAMLAPLAAAAPEYCPLEVRTATVTACFTNNGAPVKPTCDVACPTPVAKPAEDGPVQVFVQAPKCDSCGCDSCAHTNIYTTTYDVFCPTGLSKQEYVVTEVYAGMSAKPSVTEAPKVPFGFAVGVQTCNECGKKPVVATLTYPAEGCPYIQGMSEPQGAPAGSPAYAVCVDNPAGPGQPIFPGLPGSPGGGPGAGPNNVPGIAPGGGPQPGSVPGSMPGGSAQPGSMPGSMPGAAPVGSAPVGGAAPGGIVQPGSVPGSMPGGSAQPGSVPGSMPGGSAQPGSVPGSMPGGSAQPGSVPGSMPGGSAQPGSMPGSMPPAAPGAPGAPGVAPVVPAGGAQPAGGAAPGGNVPPAKGDNASPPKDGAAPPPSQPTGSSGMVQVAAAHPAFVPITMGSVLGFLLAFVAAL